LIISEYEFVIKKLELSNQDFKMILENIDKNFAEI